jgi:hypothetical protein
MFIYKELSNWAGKGIRIQEHDSCLSDIIAVNYKEKFESSEHPRFLWWMIIIIWTNSQEHREEGNACTRLMGVLGNLV